jgi:MFS family permease
LPVVSEQPTLRSTSGGAALWVAAFGVFVAADDLMVVSTMLRPMIDDVGLLLPDDLDAAAWIVNVYLIAYISAIPLAGKLSDIFGRRSVFVSALGIFLVGSLIVPSTDSFAVLLIGRALSAIGGGALVPVALAIAGDLYRGARRTRALGVLGAVETMGWVWGPLYGALLVRFLSWQWQFYLNVPLALVGIGIGWRVLDPVARADRRIDWWGAGLLTVGLMSLNIALLNEAKIQTVTGLEELTGGSGTSIAGPWLYALAAAAFGALVVLERRKTAGGTEPVIDTRFFTRRSPGTAIFLNASIGVGMVIALVNVPLFVNVVESANDTGIGPTALLAGWLLTALTATMAVTSYAGGVLAGRVGNLAPTVAGFSLATAGMLAMGLTWETDTSHAFMAAQLAVLGAGIGLVLAPTSAAVVDAADDANRGTAAGLVIMARLIGFSVGLAALTAWDLRRFNQLRDALVLPAIGEPGYETALADAAIDITTTALAETFVGAGLALALGWALTWLLGGPVRSAPASVPGVL